MKFSLLPAVIVSGLLLAPAAMAQNPQEQGQTPQRQGQRQGRRAPVALCAITGEVLKDPANTPRSEFKGRPVLFCCEKCKAKFDGGDDTFKAQRVKVTNLKSRKATLERQLADINKQLKEIEPDAAKPAEAPAEKPVAGEVYCMITDEKIGDPSKALASVSVSGGTYYFCCAGCKGKFDKADEAGKAKLVATAKARAAARAGK